VAPADAPVAAVAEDPVVPKKPAGPVDKLKASLVTVLRCERRCRTPPPPRPCAAHGAHSPAARGRCRVQEATLQEERLITTGNFKDLQRNNVKMVLPAARRLPPAARPGSGPARGSRCTIYGWLSTDDA
jgi:hypothetical protein